jgi:putative hemolysin
MGLLHRNLDMAARIPDPDLADVTLLLSSTRRLPVWLRPLIAPPETFRPLSLALGELPMHDGPAAFARRALERFGVSYRLPHDQLQRVPMTGAAIVVANHPFGGVDGLIAIAALAERRPDLKILAHGLLSRIPALAGIVLPVDPFVSRSGARANAPSVRRALRHLEAGGLLLMFPAGEVSHFSPRRGSVSDAHWSPGAARIVQLSGAPVVPMYFHGRNSLLFQVGGLLHARVRTLLLMRELLNKAGQCVDVRIGRLLPPARLAEFDQADSLAAHLRTTTYLLGCDAPERKPQGRAAQVLREPVAHEVVAAEIGALDAGACLGSVGASSVYIAKACDIPHTLQEIGRLREQSFRAVGEGTGRSADIDLYDDYYEHLLVWNAADRRNPTALRQPRPVPAHAVRVP